MKSFHGKQLSTQGRYKRRIYVSGSVWKTFSGPLGISFWSVPHYTASLAEHHQHLPLVAAKDGDFRHGLFVQLRFHEGPGDAEDFGCVDDHHPGYTACSSHMPKMFKGFPGKYAGNIIRSTAANPESCMIARVIPQTITALESWSLAIYQHQPLSKNPGHLFPLMGPYSCQWGNGFNLNIVEL